MAMYGDVMGTPIGNQSSANQPGEVDNDDYLEPATTPPIPSTPPPPIPGPQVETTFKLCIAIDFGTDGIGLAYAYKGKIYVHSKWHAVRFASTIKPKTIILLDDGGEVNSFGMDAKTTLII